LAAIAGLVAVVSLLTGCFQQIAPVAGSYGGGLTSAAGIVEAGSFPRPFLIPGKDTSIRIGG
jgi:hypothetical protein